MVDKTNDKYAKLQRALKHVNRIQNSVDTARKKSGVDRIATDKHGNTVYKKEVKEMKKKDKAPSSSKQNPVAKHMRTFNKATVQRDRKKDAKRGYKKHSNAYENMQIDELSDDGLHSYISKSMKASDQAHARKYAAHNSANNAKTDSSAARLRKVSKGHAAIQKKRDAGIQQALKKVTGRAKVNATESAEKVDEGIAHYKIHRSNNNGRTWDHSPGDSYVSLSRAKEISGNMKHTGKHTPGFKVKITKHEKPKLAGPVGKLPESAEKVQESIGHVRMDRLSASAHKKVVSLLKNHEKNGSIKHDGDTDKGALFKLLKPNHHSKIHSDLRKHGAGFEIDESVEQLAEDKTLTRDQLPKKVEAVVKKVFKVIDKYKKYRGTVSVEKHGTKYTVFIAVGRNGADDEDYTGDLMSIIPWEKRKTSNIEIDVAGSVYPAPKNIIIRESLDNAKSEKDSAQMKLRHANQKVRLAKKQEREKGAVAERKETDSAAKKPEKYTKADGTIGTRMVPAHKEVQKESVEQVDELSNKKLASYVSKASSDAKSRMKKGETDGVSRFGRKTDKRMDGIDRALNKMPGKKGSRDAGNRRTDGKVSGTGSMSVVDKMKANRSKGVAPKYYGEEVEQVDEISDKLVKNYRAKAVADLHNRLDKRGSVKGNVSSRQNPKGRDKLAKSIKKTKSNLDSAKKSVFNRDKKIAKAQSARDAAVSSFKDRKDNERRIKNRDRGIERTDRKADAADKKKPGSAAKRGLRGFSGYGESVEQVDENMFGYEGKNKIKIYHSDAKVHKSAVGSFPDHHSAEFDKKKKTTTIHLKKSVDKDTAGKIGRFDSNWKTRTSYHESTEYEDVIAEALSNVVVKKMQDMVGGPDKMPRGAEFRKLKAKAQAAVKAERSAKKAAPKAVTTTKTAKGKTHKGSADASERNIIMQLRKAQDLDGNSEVRISPKRSVKLSKKKIDALLKKHDALQKPVQKRAYIVMLTKALRGMK